MSDLSQYLKEIMSFDLLTDEEEKELGSKKDQASINKMVESNLRLVVSIARRYCKSEQSMMDAIQEGNLVLIKAAEKFDPEKGFKFSTYATWWIKQAVWGVVGEEMGKGFASLDDKIGDDDDTLADIIGDDTIPPVESNLVKSDLQKDVLAVLDSLKETEAKVIKLLFGIGQSAPMSLEQVAKEMECGTERVRQLQAMALRKLRNPSRNKVLGSYI